MTVVPAVAMVWGATQNEPFTPRWWVERLYAQLSARLPRIQRFNDYYRGDHPLPWLAPQASESFHRILEMTRTNYMGLVADATTERLEVLGFRLGAEPEDDDDTWAGDEEAWRIWQANNLDALSGDVFLEAVKTGQSYMLVAPNPKDDDTPRITIEHPSQVIVEYEPGDLTDRAAGLKVWVDDRVDKIKATLYLPDKIYKYEGNLSTSPAAWTPRLDPGDNGEWPIANSLGVVPIVELRNNPQWIYDQRGLRYVGVSELEDVIDSQDRINKTIADRLMTQDFGAFPQKWANNWEDAEDPDDAGAIPLEDGGELITPDDTPALPARTVDIGRDRLIVATGPTKFGQFTAAPLDPYSNAKTEDVKDIASRTRTPSQYLLGEIVNVSGEALQAAESGLVSKVKQRQRPFAEALEEVMRLALELNGDDRAKDTAMELIWRDPEHRSIGALVDAIVKKRQVNLIPRHQALEDAGYTPQQIRRMERQFRAEQLEAALAAQLAAPQPQQPNPEDEQEGQGPPQQPGQAGPGRPPGNQPPPPQ